MILRKIIENLSIEMEKKNKENLQLNIKPQSLKNKPQIDNKFTDSMRSIIDLLLKSVNKIYKID